MEPKVEKLQESLGNYTRYVQAPTFVNMPRMSSVTGRTLPVPIVQKMETNLIDFDFPPP